MRFLTWAPGYDPYSGGVIALHRLAHNLATLGEESLIHTPFKNPAWKGDQVNFSQPLLQHQDYYDDTIVIYPEIVIGNPLGARHVVRWLLNTPGNVGGDGRYEDTDLVFKYAPYFKAPDEDKVLGELRAFDLHLDEFKNENRARSGDCYLIRKGRNKFDSRSAYLGVDLSMTIRVDDYPVLGGNSYLNGVFNESERFISFDHACFVSVQAALSGCLSIVIPDGQTSTEEWKTKFPYFQFGVAYGFDDIEWARNTISMVPGHLRALDAQSLVLAQGFIDICKERVCGRS